MPSTITLKIDAHDLSVTQRALRRLADDPDEEILNRVTALDMQKKLALAALDAVNREQQERGRTHDSNRDHELGFYL